MAALGLCCYMRVFSSCGLGSCGAQAELPCSLWDPLRPGPELRFPALAGSFSVTEPPGKYPHFIPFSWLIFPILLFSFFFFFCFFRF